MILILPVPTVLSLQMSRRRKLAVLGIICFGSLSVVTALCRFIVQKQLISEPDTSYIMGRMVIVAGIEIQIAVVAVNLPALRSLFTTIVGSSHEASGYCYDRYNKGQGVHRLGSLPSHSRGQSTSRGRRLVSRKSGNRGGLGDTLTGSEEELVRRQGNNIDKIQVVTDVDIVSSHGGDEGTTLDIGFPPAKGVQHIRGRQ